MSALSVHGAFKCRLVTSVLLACVLLACVLLTSLLLTGCSPPLDPSQDSSAPLQVFAAASLRDVASDLAVAFEDREAGQVVLNTAGSNVLAQQIVATTRADVFISADRQWIDFLEGRGRLVADTRRDVLANSLVVVARPDSPHRLQQLSDLATLPYRRLAVADPDAVPAGRYARAYLETVPWPAKTSDSTPDGSTLWQAVTERLVPTLDVRAALALSASDPDILAVVYRTDALESPEVSVLWTLPNIPQVPITYCAAVIEGGHRTALGRRFLDFLESPEGAEIIHQHGFDHL